MLLTHHTDTLDTYLAWLWQCVDGSVTVWHGECDEPDGGKRGILLWRM